MPIPLIVVVYAATALKAGISYYEDGVRENEKRLKRKTKDTLDKHDKQTEDINNKFGGK